MKTLKHIFTTFIILLTLSLGGCKSDEPMPVPQPGDENYLELPGADSFRELSIGAPWTVVENPEWAAPMALRGDASTPLTVYVEPNYEDSDRTGTLRVLLGDGKEKLFTLFQPGLVSDDSNGSELGGDNLRTTYGVGYGINVYRQSKLTKYAVSSSSPLNFGRLKTALDSVGLNDAMADEKRYFSRIESVTGSSTSALANQLSINAGIEVGISGFKLGVEGGFGKSSDESSRCEYAIEEIQHIVGSRHLRPGAVQYLAEHNFDIFQTTFKAWVEELVKNPADESVMAKIVNRYGTHIITQGSLGGELKLSMKMLITEKTSSSDIHAALSLGSKVADVNASFDMSGKNGDIAKNTTIYLQTFGGKNVFTISGGSTFDSFFKYMHGEGRMESWVSAIRSGELLSLIDVELFPIYELMPTAETKANLRNFIVGKYQTDCYSSNASKYPGPDLYVLKGFDKVKEGTRETSVYIPEIDMEVVAFRSMFKDLSETEYSTVIYAGNKGDVNRECGFFIGSATRKPCKFKYNKKGEIIKEEFSALKAGELTELYVDATGDVTIFPKGVADLYRDVTFPAWENWTDWIDLTIATDNNITVSGERFLTGDIRNSAVGKADLPLVITLEEGAKLHLYNTMIRGGMIRCAGNATICLEPGTVNVFDGLHVCDIEISDLAGIQVGPKGTTLTIDGPGKLKMDQNKAGIGFADGDGGNIVIKDGDITIHVQAGPAIGAAEYSSVENITIQGGTITALTGPWSNRDAAIGSGDHSRCGDILITKDVTSVVARTSGALQAIGKGMDEYSWCGKITIEDRKKVTEDTKWDGETL